MDEGACDQGNQWNIQSIKSHDENHIHNTDDESFDENCFNRSNHLIYDTKKICMYFNIDDARSFSHFLLDNYWFYCRLSYGIPRPIYKP